MYASTLSALLSDEGSKLSSEEQKAVPSTSRSSLKTPAVPSSITVIDANGSQLLPCSMLEAQ